jgi:5-hydroxyisourate hydrolase
MTSPITTHVLDTARGRPAAGLAVVLERAVGGRWEPLGRGTTDADGRLRSLLPAPAAGQAPAAALAAGEYRLTFDTAAYFATLGVRAFYASVPIQFVIEAASEAREVPHYHVPLLLSPFGYSTYRGS